MTIGRYHQEMNTGTISSSSARQVVGHAMWLNWCTWCFEVGKITEAQKQALVVLKKEKSIMILPADKGNATVLTLHLNTSGIINKLK